MKIKNRIGIEFIFLFLLLLLCLSQKKIFAINAEKRACAMCHARWIGEGEEIDTWKRMSVLLVDDIEFRLAADEDVCFSCHNGGVLDSRNIIRKYMETRHPVGIVPSKNISIPSNFPLDKNGKLYCGTCHSAHGGLGEETQADVEKGTFLRYPNKNSELCKMCHVDKLGGKPKGTHPIDVSSLPISKRIIDNGGLIGDNGANHVICESCHVVHGSPYEKLLVLTRGTYSDDQASELCEGCHKNNPSIPGHGPGMDSHPVDVKQITARMPDKWESGRKAIKTSDNRVICRSCHNPHAGVANTSLLEDVGDTKENYKNFLCKQCHQDKLSSEKMENNPGLHPVGLKVPETMQPKAQIPFDKDRKLMCISCHMPHNAVNNSNTDGTDGRILRVTNENSLLCKECHGEKYAAGISEAESQGMHPILIKPKEVVLDEAITRGGQVGKDGVLVCTSCHNIHKGAKNSPILIETNKDSKVCEICHKSKLANSKDKTLTGIKHPIGAKPKTVKIPEEIYAAGGKLSENGEIICAICHKPHKAVQNTPLLILENIKSSMCLKCHTDKIAVKASDHNLLITDPLARNLRGQTVAEGGVCSACHFSHQWARQLDGSGDLTRQFCLSCHGEGGPAEKKPIGQYSHPTGVTLKNIGDGTCDLPLFKERGSDAEWGEKNVFCNTCHDPHKWSPDKEDKEEEHYENVEGGAQNSFLRKLNDSKSSLCLNCHKDKKNVVNTEHDLNITSPKAKNTIEQTAGEGGVCSACHLPHNGKQRRIWARRVVSSDGDPGSQLCKSCHSKGNPAETKLLNDNYTHPVNAAIKNADGNTSLPLFAEDGSRKDAESGGKVICYTCHDPHQWIPGEDKEGPGKNIEGDGSNSFLRLKNDYNLTLCGDCHEDKKYVKKTDHDLTITGPDAKNKDGLTVKESGICLACHSIHNGIDNKMWNRELTVKGDVISKLCLSCHSKGKVGAAKLVGELTHPTDKTILAVDRIPEILPTFTPEGNKAAKGKVYCNSCHDLHKWDPEKNEEGPGKNEEGDMTNSFLRVKNPQSELCMECHSKKKFLLGTKHDMRVAAPTSVNTIGQKPERSGVCGACHVPHNASDYRLWARVPYPGEDLGIVLCLSCHSKGNVGQKKQIGKYSHPVNVVFKDNPKVGTSTSFPLYTDKGIISQSEGKVICMSCHDVHKWNPEADEYGDGTMTEGIGSNSFLRRANDNKGDLCTDCHVNQAFIVDTDHDMNITGLTEKNYLGQTIAQSGPCSACHTVHNAYMQLKLWGRIPGKNSEERQMDVIATFCYSCHQIDSVAKEKVPEVLFHPPKILVSTVGRGGKGKGSYWPVYKFDGELVGSGMITCATCHNLHKWKPEEDSYGIGKNLEGDATNSFLRNKGASFSLCTDCHESDAIMRYKYYHVERNRSEHRGKVH